MRYPERVLTSAWTSDFTQIDALSRTCVDASMAHKSSIKIKSLISLRLILISFALLTFFASMNLLWTTSHLSVTPKMSKKMKASMFGALDEALTKGPGDYKDSYSTNSLRSFHSKYDVMKDRGHLFRTYESFNYELDDTAKHFIEQIVINISSHISNSSATVASAPAHIIGNSNMSVKLRQSSCVQCFLHNFKYIIQNEEICNISDGGTVDLLLLILTRHQNFKARRAIRETWVKPSERNTKNIRYVFLLGQTLDKKLSKLVQEENYVHHDIIKEDFVDNYKNLTYKTIMGLKWASTMCAHARFVMKTDDDMWVNIPNLLRTLDKKGRSYMETRIIGACLKNVKPNRNPNSKWFASNEDYPNSRYPGYCSGTGYVTSMNVAKKVYEISSNVPFFHLEDVFVSLCVYQLNFTLTATPGFNIRRLQLEPCFYKGTRLITAHQITPFMLKAIWNGDCQHVRNKTQPMSDGLPQTLNVRNKSPHSWFPDRNYLGRGPNSEILRPGGFL